MQEQAVKSDGAVITSWWRHSASQTDSGTPIEWLSTLSGVLIEVHCLCSPNIAAERFLSRQRHRGHLDKFKTYEEVLAEFQQHASLGALGIGQLIEVNTEENVEISVLMEKINKYANQ